MFARDIEPIARVAIQHSEWNTLDFLLKNLYEWMDSPDYFTAQVAGNIGILLDEKFKGEPYSNPMAVKYIPVAHRLLSYAVVSLKLGKYGHK